MKMVCRRIGMRDHVGGDVAAGARLVLDHTDGPDLLQGVADEARSGVGRAAGVNGTTTRTAWRPAAPRRGTDQWKARIAAAASDKTARLSIGALLRERWPIASGRDVFP